jgi:hypothetical protein
VNEVRRRVATALHTSLFGPTQVSAILCILDKEWLHDRRVNGDRVIAMPLWVGSEQDASRPTAAFHKTGESSAMVLILTGPNNGYVIEGMPGVTAKGAVIGTFEPATATDTLSGTCRVSTPAPTYHA